MKQTKAYKVLFSHKLTVKEFEKMGDAYFNYYLGNHKDAKIDNIISVSDTKVKETIRALRTLYKIILTCNGRDDYEISISSNDEFLRITRKGNSKALIVFRLISEYKDVNLFNIKLLFRNIENSKDVYPFSKLGIKFKYDLSHDSSIYSLGDIVKQPEIRKNSTYHDALMIAFDGTTGLLEMRGKTSILKDLYGLSSYQNISHYGTFGKNNKMEVLKEGLSSNRSYDDITLEQKYQALLLRDQSNPLPHSEVACQTGITAMSWVQDANAELKNAAFRALTIEEKKFVAHRLMVEAYSDNRKTLDINGNEVDMDISNLRDYFKIGEIRKVNIRKKDK